MSAAGAALDTSILALMLAAGVSYTVALVLEMGMPAASSYPIYDDIATSAARFFMPNKMEADQDALAAGALEVVSAVKATDYNPKRWSLADDESGFDDMGQMTASVAHVSSLVTLSMSVHGIVLLLAVFRMLYSLSFQPRFGIIAKTLVRAAPGLVGVMLLTSLVLVLLASLGHYTWFWGTSTTSSAP